MKSTSKDEYDFDLFAEKCLDTCINKNHISKKTGYVYSMEYEYDNIVLTCEKRLNDMEASVYQSVNITSDEYCESDKSDKDIIEDLFKTIVPKSQF